MSENIGQVGPPAGLVDRLGDGLTRVCLGIAAMSLLSIVAINGANVIGRYFFGRPFSWAEELMLYLMILGVFSGGTAITWRNMHIRIDTLVERTSPQVQHVARVLAIVISIAVLTTIMGASYGIVALLKSFDQRSYALNAPMWIPQGFVTAGLALMALLMAVKLVTSRLRADQTPQPPSA
jgi:TRAP-type C4-dicarboxylate transport system permease small subunit